LACVGEEFKKHLWWKKYITQLQMLQFVLVFFHSVKAILTPNCWTPLLAYAECFHASLFFHMFFTFYRRAYWNAKPSTVTNSHHKAIANPLAKSSSATVTQSSTTPRNSNNNSKRGRLVKSKQS